MSGELLPSWDRRASLAGPSGGFQEDRSLQGMLVWDGWMAVHPRGRWKETSEVWVLLGVCWILREGAGDSVNIKLRSKHPAHARPKRWVPEPATRTGCVYRGTHAHRVSLPGVCLQTARLWAVKGSSVAAATASTTIFCLPARVSVPAHGNPGRDAKGWQIAVELEQEVAALSGEVSWVVQRLIF